MEIRQDFQVTPAERPERLRQARNAKMARSAHAYVRGSTTKFYEWLETSAAKVAEGPPVWICGDCHMGNLGPLSDAKGRVAVQIRDLDQTVIGNPAHDLVRLGLSLASEARGSALPGLTTLRMIEQLVSGYVKGLEGKASKGRSSDWAPKAVRLPIRRATQRRWRHLAEERLATVRPVVPLGRRFWAITDEERAAIGRLLQEQDVRRAVTHLKEQRDDASIKLVDVAYWMKGCSSLGRLRYAVMAEVGDHRDRSLCLLDIKEATAAAAPRSPDVSMPRDHASRVVQGARALSPSLGERMVASRLFDKSVVLRELMPQDLKFDIDGVSEEDAMQLSFYLAGVVGLAHRRQMDEDALRSWRVEMSKAQSRTIDAPSWLWTSIVELMAIHEGAYLEHCRRYGWREPEDRS